LNLTHEKTRFITSSKQSDCRNCLCIKFQSSPVGPARKPNADPGHLNLFNDASVIDLAGTKASDADLEPLRDSKSLDFLNLTGCRITDSGLAKLAGLANLQYLLLGDTNVTDEGFSPPRLWPSEEGNGREPTASRVRVFRKCCVTPAPLVSKGAILAPSSRC
jgi:Leucine Rich repeat